MSRPRVLDREDREGKISLPRRRRTRTPEGPYFSIGEIARQVGITTRTIRYYEEFGLLGSVMRVESGRRVYTGDVIRRLKFIKRLKVLGLSLEEMRSLEEMYVQNRSNDKVLPQLLLLLDGHLGTIDSRIEQLRTLKQEIETYKSRIRSKL